jgi:hypothetical protein
MNIEVLDLPDLGFTRRTGLSDPPKFKTPSKEEIFQQ